MGSGHSECCVDSGLVAPAHAPFLQGPFRPHSAAQGGNWERIGVLASGVLPVVEEM